MSGRLDDDVNLYAYVGNDPLGLVDPRGTAGEAAVLKEVVVEGAKKGFRLNPVGMLLLIFEPSSTAADDEINPGEEKPYYAAEDDDGTTNSPNQDGENSGDKDPSTPVGKRGSPLDVPKGTNEPATIGGRDYGGHALDQMQGRGVPPTPVEDTIKNGTQTPGNKPGRIVHTSQDGRLKVVTEGGKVITVITK